VIIASLCNHCFQPFRLVVRPDEVSLLKQISDPDGLTCECPRKCGGRINLVGDDVLHAMAGDRRLREPVPLTGKELYKAVNGLGLPDEIPKSALLVEGLLTSKRVVGSHVEQVGEDFYLHELHFEGGAVMHLAAGARGAQVLKITEEKING
jgi:hypothetical protein